MENTINTFLIKDYIKKNKLSKNKFCKMCKISSQTLSKILSNNTHIMLSTILKIARQLRIKSADLFN